MTRSIRTSIVCAILAMLGCQSLSPERPDSAPSRFNLEPRVIDAQANTPASELKILLAKLVREGNVNISLNVGDRRVPLPICIAHGCYNLWFFDGPVEVNEHSRPNDSRIWISVICNDEEGLEIPTARFSPYSCAEPCDADDPPLPPDPMMKILDSLRPQSGRWRLEDIRRLLDHPEVSPHSPRFQIKFTPGCPANGIVSALDLLRMAGGNHAVTELGIQDQ